MKGTRQPQDSKEASLIMVDSSRMRPPAKTEGSAVAASVMLIHRPRLLTGACS